MQRTHNTAQNAWFFINNFSMRKEIMFNIKIMTYQIIMDDEIKIKISMQSI